MFKPNNIVIFILSLIFLLSSWNIISQKKNLIFETYSSEQGLSQNSVLAIDQDKFGFIWLGTENGLNKFDGYNIITYFHDVDDKASISSGNIMDIKVDTYNRLWIATANGLNCFDQETEKFHLCLASSSDSVSIIGNSMNCVFIDSDNYLWVGSRDGLNKTVLPISKNMNYKNLEFIDFSEKLSNKNVSFYLRIAKKIFGLAQKMA